MSNMDARVPYVLVWKGVGVLCLAMASAMGWYGDGCV